MLDQGRASAYAAHLLAIKCSKGAGFVLNEKHIAREYGIGWRTFQSGLGILKRTGVLERCQIGRRSYAREKLADESKNFVLFGEKLLKANSHVVAFAFVANLSPHPMRPVEIAARIGVRAEKTIRLLVKAVTEGEFISATTTARGAIMIARKGYKFEQYGTKNADLENDPGKSGATKIGAAKNGATHSRREKGTVDEKSSQKRENFQPHGTRSNERVLHDLKFEGSRERKELGPEWIVLKDWKTSTFWRENGFFTEPGKIDLSNYLDYWRNLLNWYGLNTPGHLHTPQSCKQALEICNYLKMIMSGSNINDVLSAFAFWVCRAHASGKIIRSFGFIAEELYRRMMDGDDT